MPTIVYSLLLMTDRCCLVDSDSAGQRWKTELDRENIDGRSLRVELRRLLVQGEQVFPRTGLVVARKRHGYAGGRRALSVPNMAGGCEEEI